MFYDFILLSIQMCLCCCVCLLLQCVFFICLGCVKVSRLRKEEREEEGKEFAAMI